MDRSTGRTATGEYPTYADHLARVALFVEAAERLYQSCPDAEKDRFRRVVDNMLAGRSAGFTTTRDCFGMISFHELDQRVAR